MINEKDSLLFSNLEFRPYDVMSFEMETFQVWNFYASEFHLVFHVTKKVNAASA